MPSWICELVWVGIGATVLGCEGSDGSGPSYQVGSTGPACAVEGAPLGLSMAEIDLTEVSQLAGATGNWVDYSYRGQGTVKSSPDSAHRILVTDDHAQILVPVAPMEGTLKRPMALAEFTEGDSLWIELTGNGFKNPAVTSHWTYDRDYFTLSVTEGEGTALLYGQLTNNSYSAPPAYDVFGLSLTLDTACVTTEENSCVEEGYVVTTRYSAVVDGTTSAYLGVPQAIQQNGSTLNLLLQTAYDEDGSAKQGEEACNDFGLGLGLAFCVWASVSE